VVNPRCGTGKSGLEHTVVRPGRLSDEPRTGLIHLAAELEVRGTITRDDVASVLVACIDQPATIGKIFEILNGATPIDEALSGLRAGSGAFLTDRTSLG